MCEFLKSQNEHLQAEIKRLEGKLEKKNSDNSDRFLQKIQGEIGSFLDGVTPPAEVAGPSKMVQLLQGIDDYLVPYGKLSAMHTTCKRDGRTLFRLLINNFKTMENILKGERVEHQKI